MDKNEMLEDSLQRDKIAFEKTVANLMGKSGEEDTDSLRDSSAVLKNGA